MASAIRFRSGDRAHSFGVRRLAWTLALVAGCYEAQGALGWVG
jgi:hypothetical protein